MPVSSKNPMPIIGYADRFSVQPGQTISFMVSSDSREYDAEIIRMIHADSNKIGPGYKEEPIDTSVGRSYPGKKKNYPKGSYVIVDGRDGVSLSRGFTIQAWIFPTRPAKREQGIVTFVDRRHRGRSAGLTLDGEGRLTLALNARDGKESKLHARTPLSASTWYFVACTFDAETESACVVQEPAVVWPGETGEKTSGKVQSSSYSGDLGTVLIAAYSGAESASGHFNGKIDRPRLFARALTAEELRSLREGASPAAKGLGLVADWDFSRQIGTNLVVDTSEYQLHGTVINSPKRAVTGHNWSGREIDFKRAPQEYGAIHFHEDDLDDCRWEKDVEFQVPEGMRSGIYALKLKAPGHVDYVPFFVRPKMGARTLAKIAFLVPTLSYLAYGNDHFISDPELQRRAGMPKGFAYPSTRIDKYLVATNLLSLYDKHTDKSGVCYVSKSRPILTMRPDYLEAVQADGKGAPHQFPADLWITDWMEAKGFRYDVITDEDLHHEGMSVIKPYRVIVTGTHPEYWTAQMLTSLERYLNEGGRVMYMGGNGFYWVTSIDPKRPHICEVRRWGGTQSWTSEPGEYYHSSTGELGGLWRNRNRAPQKMLGVGFTAQGHGPNRPYARLPDSFDRRAAFIFEGIGKDELIGDFDCLDQGPFAAGYEFDRMDLGLGTPKHALLLASATGFSDHYQHAIEEVDSADSKQGGTVNEKVRADMTYLEYPNGGAVFCTGSVSWSGCLFFNHYQNNVSRITENVLRAFSDRDELPS